jgi:hypothetical protein
MLEELESLNILTEVIRSLTLEELESLNILTEVTKEPNVRRIRVLGYFERSYYRA